MNTVGEPDEGKPHVRFDEGRLGRLPLNQSPTLQLQLRLGLPLLGEQPDRAVHSGPVPGHHDLPRRGRA